MLLATVDGSVRLPSEVAADQQFGPGAAESARLRLGPPCSVLALVSGPENMRR